ncbi:aromatic ring-hydroxylating dioxygenase subunit alpha [Steroidobacter flavus]|uniref:Aromatic ring-hydroxylating dioxygenase subunit alpha n=1 Tax=Steroidobacter flavus TaxID=1842136 RepID=A0ABV8T0Z9_9GAMM
MNLQELIARQRPGWSLEQPFYTSAEIYDLERKTWLARQWYVLGHSSEVRESGSFIVRDLLGESLIIVRGNDGTVRGFFNVCRHRGSRICDADGKAASLMCPYHAWTYRLDGTLRSAPALPEGIDTSQLGLRPAPVKEIGGVILGSLQGELESLEPVRQALEPALIYHGVPNARIAARRHYPTRGNWKLVMENFMECYHCFPAHPEYCSVMRHVDALGRVSSDGAARWQQTLEEWLRNQANPDSPIGNQQFNFTAPVQSYGATRAPIGGGCKTQTKDGEPAAPLMGEQSRFDGGVSTLRIDPFVYIAALNDYVRLFQFLPTGPETTDVVLTWLVDGEAREPDVDIEKLVWLWDVTTVQDKALIERNAAGIRSTAYSPGPYSTLESMPAQFVGRYLRELAL